MTITTPRPFTSSMQSTPSAPLVEVFCDEDLDISTLWQFGERLEDAVRLRPERLVVDLSACRYLDAQVMTVLLEAHRALYRTGGVLVLRGASESARRLLALAGLSDVFVQVPGNDWMSARARVIRRHDARPPRGRDHPVGSRGDDHSADPAASQASPATTDGSSCLGLGEAGRTPASGSPVGSASGWSRSS